MEVGPFFLSNINGFLLFFIGYFYTKYPPKKINHFSGYRTRRSMANQQIWDYANRLSAKMICRLGIMLLFIGTVFYFLYEVDIVVLVTTFVMLIGLGVGMYWCETELNKRFDKNGNPIK